MKLVIGEYLRALRERDELDRLLPDLLVEMGYVPIARPQTGNRQFGVDLAARGKNPKNGKDELLLLVVKQGDIGRGQWDTGVQAVRPSLNEIFDVYLRTHVEPEDRCRQKHVVLVTNGELKQALQPDWTGFVANHESSAILEFWGADHLADLVERHLLDEYVFRDQDRKHLRRALALSNDSEYDQRDLNELYLDCLGLERDGSLRPIPKNEKELVKALRIVSFSAHIFVAWSSSEGDARQGLKAMERALLWSWHRIQFADGIAQTLPVAEAFSALWVGYLVSAHRYFEKIQAHLVVEDGISGYYSDGAEFSLVAFEQIGILASIGLSLKLCRSNSEEVTRIHEDGARIVAESLASLIENNGICSSPCFDRHCNDITLALSLLHVTGLADRARNWLAVLVRNVDYAYKVKRYVPISTDSMEGLVEEGGWSGGTADVRQMNMSWLLPTLAGWCATLDMEDHYNLLSRESSSSYSGVCMQLWHPDAELYKCIYFKPAHFESGASEAPIKLPETMAAWRDHMAKIVASNQSEIAASSPAKKCGMDAIDLIAMRHFKTPIPPIFWYKFLLVSCESNQGSPTASDN